MVEQLDSIVMQSQLPDEIVLCDDASEDRTIEIARRYEKNLPIRIIVNKQRLGATKNFSNCIAACSGDIIFLCDQDDIWEPQKIEKITRIFRDEKRPGLVFSDAVLIDQYSRFLAGSLWEANRFSQARRASFESSNALAHLLRSNIVTGATAAFRSNLKEAILPIPPYWIHDYWIATVISMIEPIYCESSMLTRYRTHPNQQVGIHHNAFHKLWSLMFKQRDFYVEREKYSGLKNWVERSVSGKTIQPNAIELINRKLAHIEVRNEVALHLENSRSRLIKEILSGNYARYSYGWIDIFTDIFLAVRPIK